MKHADLDFLTSPSGAQVLADLADADLSDAATLPLLTRLRKTLAPEQAGAAVEQAKLRRKAVAKFGAAAAVMLFTRDGLEQASDPAIRRHRAAAARDIGRIIDACCGIGSDALAFAAEDRGAATTVLGLDLDPLRVDIARYNAAALGITGAWFEVADVTHPLPEAADLVFFDPARRDDTGKRLHHVERYLPPLSTITRWDAPRIWAKLSPAVELDDVRGYGGVLAFHSVDGDLKEAVLHCGDGAATGQPGIATEAVLHDADGSHVWAWTDPPPEMPERAPQGWLLEPDASLLRAGYVRQLAAQLGAAQIDPTIAYLTMDSAPDTRWARAWRIHDWMPFNLKRLKAYLRERGIGRVTVKKRGHAMTPEQLLAALKPDGSGDERVVVLTRVLGQPAVVICEPPTPR